MPRRGRPMRRIVILEHDEEQQQRSAAEFSGGQSTSSPTPGSDQRAGSSRLLQWGGGSYQASLDGARNTTSDSTDPFNPRLLVELQLQLSPSRCCATSRSTDPPAVADRPEAAGNRRRAAPAAARRRRPRGEERVLRSGGRDRPAGRSRSSRSSSRSESLRNNERRVEVGTMAPIDIVEAQAEVARNEEAVIITEAQIKSAGRSAAGADS